MTTYATNNPLGSTDPRDLYDNAQNFDHLSLDQENIEWPDRLGHQRKTWFGLQYAVQQAASSFGYIVLSGVSFTTGATVNLNEVLLDTATGEYYQWTGEFPSGGKIVPPSSSPSTTGGEGPGKWLAVGYAALKQMLAAYGGESLVGGATYAQIRASNVTGNQIKCLGRSANRDGGEGWFFLDAADTTTADDDGTVLVDSVGRRWKRSYDSAKMAAWWGVIDGADISTPLQNALNTGGGKIEFKDGQYTVTTGAVIDFSTATIPPVGRRSKRFSLVGESQHDTTFNTNGNTLLTYTGDTQGDGQGLFSSMRIADFCIYGTNNTGVAMRLKSAVGLNVENIQIRRHDYGLFLSGVLTSKFDNVYLDYNNTGLYIESATNSQVNNVTFNDLKCNSNNQHGIIGNVGIRVTFNRLSCESCGWNTNDTGGNSNTGPVYLNVVVPFSIIEFNQGYFEANEGLADITINNNTASPIIVNINGTDFTRGNIRGRGCTNVLNFLSTGGGPILLNLRGASFITNTGTGFVANPAWVDKPFLRVTGVDTCTFSDPATLPSNSMAQGQPLPICVSSTGAMTAGPTWLTVTKTSTGVYTITSTYTLGVDNDSFVVMSSPRVTGFRVDVTKNSRINLTVRVRDSTGTLADGAFDLAILTGRGEGR